LENRPRLEQDSVMNAVVAVLLYLAEDERGRLAGVEDELSSDADVALLRVGEISGTLDQVLELLGQERMRSEAMRRKLTDAMQYPLFVLIAAICVSR
jgi:general secretion pathway protein F